MPYLVWSMFTQVDINPNVASAYTTDDYEPNLVLRGNSLAFRSQVSLYLRQWLTILKLNSDKASDSLSMQDYNSALQTHIRAIPLVNKGVTLVKNETKETSERMRYFYQVLGSNERGGKSKAKPAKDEESELLANDGDIETFEGEGISSFYLSFCFFEVKCRFRPSETRDQERIGRSWCRLLVDGTLL